MDLFNMPVTLVVKAPNQKIEDQTIECDFAWTVKKVKQHISSVYPSKPEENQQKLIYSGRLLHDHLVLKDVLRQYDTNQTTHTVHLVCASGMNELSQNLSHARSDRSISPNTSSPAVSESSSVPSTPSMDGLRQRHVQNDAAPASVSSREATPTMTPPAGTPPTPAMPMSPQDAFLQMYGANNPMMYGGYYPGMMGLSPEQMVWMQQMYAQQMAQFMQIYQPENMPLTTPPSPGVTEEVANQAAADNQPAANQRAGADQPVRMNAGGGAMFDDEDEDGANRDWLDWVYTFSRFSVLLSIVYFYSTLGRFFVVFGFFFLVYLYQGGWLRVRRRVIVPNNNNNRQQAPQQQQQPQQQQPQQEAAPPPAAQDVQQQPQDTPQNEAEGGESEGGNVPAEGASEPPAPPQPRPLAIAWSFVSTFFSSLVPQQPPAVNAN